MLGPPPSPDVVATMANQTNWRQPKCIPIIFWVACATLMASKVAYLQITYFFMNYFDRLVMWLTCANSWILVILKTWCIDMVQHRAWQHALYQPISSWIITRHTMSTWLQQIDLNPSIMKVQNAIIHLHVSCESNTKIIAKRLGWSIWDWWLTWLINCGC